MLAHDYIDKNQKIYDYSNHRTDQSNQLGWLMFNDII